MKKNFNNADLIQDLFEIQKHDYDLISLDVATPEYTGLDTLSQ